MCLWFCYSLDRDNGTTRVRFLENHCLICSRVIPSQCPPALRFWVLHLVRFSITSLLQFYSWIVRLSTFIVFRLLFNFFVHIFIYFVLFEVDFLPFLLVLRKPYKILALFLPYMNEPKFLTKTDVLAWNRFLISCKLILALLVPYVRKRRKNNLHFSWIGSNFLSLLQCFFSFSCEKYYSEYFPGWFSLSVRDDRTISLPLFHLLLVL